MDVFFTGEEATDQYIYVNVVKKNRNACLVSVNLPEDPMSPGAFAQGRGPLSWVSYRR